MKYYSTRHRAQPLSISEAILTGLATDGGLYVPESFISLEARSLVASSSLAELAFEVLSPWFQGDQLATVLPELCMKAFDFPLELHWFNDQAALLELFHGPTSAFKDFGARFLAVTLEQILASRGEEITILVATSGDTGSAVAAAFYQRQHIKVKILYPQTGVSERQEQQLTCWDTNVEAYAVDGTFDDCQRMVKAAFADQELATRYQLSSANSINIGRLLPQMVYAWYGALEVVRCTSLEPVAIIPSGNVGNACASYWAKESGAPLHSISLALNANRTVAEYVKSGHYQGRASVATLANAMDVGDPSNMERLLDLYPSHEEFIRHVRATSVSDTKIRQLITEIYQRYNYAICPHTATGEFVRKQLKSSQPTLVYATAHPAKFDTIVEPLIGTNVPVPEQLAAMLAKERNVQNIKADYRLLFE